MRRAFSRSTTSSASGPSPRSRRSRPASSGASGVWSVTCFIAAISVAEAAVELGDARRDPGPAELLVELERRLDGPVVLVGVEPAGRDPGRLRLRVERLVRRPAVERLERVEARDRGPDLRPGVGAAPDEPGAARSEDPLVGARPRRSRSRARRRPSSLQPKPCTPSTISRQRSASARPALAALHDLGERRDRQPEPGARVHPGEAHHARPRRDRAAQPLDHLVRASRRRPRRGARCAARSRRSCRPRAGSTRGASSGRARWSGSPGPAGSAGRCRAAPARSSCSARARSPRGGPRGSGAIVALQRGPGCARAASSNITSSSHIGFASRRRRYSSIASRTGFGCETRKKLARWIQSGARLKSPRTAVQSSAPSAAAKAQAGVLQPETEAGCGRRRQTRAGEERPAIESHGTSGVELERIRSSSQVPKAATASGSRPRASASADGREAARADSPRSMFTDPFTVPQVEARPARCRSGPRACGATCSRREVEVAADAAVDGARLDLGVHVRRQRQAHRAVRACSRLRPWGSTRDERGLDAAVHRRRLDLAHGVAHLDRAVDRLASTAAATSLDLDAPVDVRRRLTRAVRGTWTT